MESIKKALIPFIPPPMRGLTCNSVFILFEAIVKALKFLFQQFFFVHRVKFIFFIVWLVVWLIAIHRYDFGALYFMISTLIFMLYNLGSRKDGTLSAYSVFNPRGVRLLGQLDASNFENEIRHRNNNFDDDDDVNDFMMMNDDNNNNNNRDGATKRIKRGNSKKARRAEAKRKKKMMMTQKNTDNNSDDE